MPDRDAMVAAIETHCRALTAGDKEAWLRIWADDVVLEDPVGVDTFRGIDSLRTRFWDIIESISPMRIWLEQEVIVCGHEAIAILAADVNREGPTHGVGPLVDHFTFNEEGRIASMRAFWKYEGVPGY